MQAQQRSISLKLVACVSRYGIIQHGYCPSTLSSLSTTSEKSLPLTFFDLRMVDSSVKLLFFFECTSISKNHFLESIIPSLKQSLSLSLKYYYPFAGNLIFPPNSGKPEIRYLERDSASLIFAESSSDFIHLTGKQTRDTTEFLSFLPQLPPESMSHDTLVVPISSFQVTLFPDSGICVGLHLRHAIGDGSSVVKSFLKTWASITKAGGDATFLSGEFVPYYDRTCLRDPESLQDFTVLPTDQFRRCVIRSSSVIFLPTSSPMDYVRRLSLHRWFPFPSYIGWKNKKIICWWFYRRNLRAKKNILAWNIPTDFYSVSEIVIDRRKLSIGKSVCDCMKYRPNISVCKFVATGGSYC